MVSLFRRGSTWWVTYQAGSRQVRRSLATDNRRIALDLKLQVERRLLLGEPEAPEKRSLAEYLEEYRASSQARKRPRTHATDMARLEDFVGALNCDCLGDATTADVSRFLDRKVNRDGIGTTTVLRYREILHAFFEHARRLGYVRENPVSPIPRPRLPEREPAFLRQEQVERVLEAVGRDRIYAIGLRQSSRTGRLHVSVRIRREEFLGLKAYFLDIACKRSTGQLRWEYANLPFEPYRGVKRQYGEIARAVNAERKAQRLEAVPLTALPRRRTVVFCVRPKGLPVVLFSRAFLGGRMHWRT